ncbi:MAG: tetratricopeptide repeat protein, partial [Planctomycetota bacterium]
MNARTLITMMVLQAILIAGGCAGPQERTIQTQQERNWLGADPAAISTAKEVEEPKILPQTHFAAARLFEQQGNIEKAIIQYRKAVAVNHDYVAAYNRLGILLGRVGRHTDAEKALRQAIELRPEAAYLRNNLGFEYALQWR